MPVHASRPCSYPGCGQLTPPACPKHKTYKRGGTPERIRGRKLQTIRAEVFLNANYRCAICNRVSARLELDHKIPLHQGGTDTRDNQQPLCKHCHKLKTSNEMRGV